MVNLAYGINARPGDEIFSIPKLDAIVKYAHVTSDQLATVVSISPLLDRIESDRVARIAKLYALAGEVLGSDEAARRLMLTPNRPLDNNDRSIFSRPKVKRAR